MKIKNREFMKLFLKKNIILILAFFLIYFYFTRLPFGLRFTKIDTEYYIHDEGGCKILAEQYYIDDNKQLPKVLKMIKYSKNKLGLVVMIKSENNQFFFVAVKPKNIQNYLPELEVNYSIFSQQEYNNLKIFDFWTNVRWM
jgi:hypothetical protein